MAAELSNAKLQDQQKRAKFTIQKTPKEINPKKELRLNILSTIVQ